MSGSTLEWYHEHEGRILHQRLQGDITLAEVSEASDEALALLRAGRPPIHLLLDVSNLGKFPLSAHQLSKAAAYIHDPNLGWVLLVGPSSIMATFAGIITQIAGVRLRSFADVDEALGFIATQDPSLVR